MTDEEHMVLKNSTRQAYIQGIELALKRVKYISGLYEEKYRGEDDTFNRNGVATCKLIVGDIERRKTETLQTWFKEDSEATQEQ
jgi:hypothetical protein